MLRWPKGDRHVLHFKHIFLFQKLVFVLTNCFSFLKTYLRFQKPVFVHKTSFCFQKPVFVFKNLFSFSKLVFSFEITISFTGRTNSKPFLRTFLFTKSHLLLQVIRRATDTHLNNIMTTSGGPLSMVLIIRG